MADSELKFTESTIQDQLYHSLPPREWVVPNVHHFLWESDLLTVLKSGRCEEYEIKCSRSDFLADRKKSEKFEILQTGFYTKTRYDWRTKQQEPAGRASASRPNRFYYVTAPDIVTLDDIPYFAGWMEVKGRRIHEVKTAPLLHDARLTEEDYRRLGRSMMFRYWQLKQRVEK